MSSDPSVVAVALGPSQHSDISKQKESVIELVAGHGIEGDRHADKPGRHVSLLQNESLEELNGTNKGLDRVLPSQLGENITTRGLNLAELNAGTKLRFVDGNGDGCSAVVKLTGLRRAGEKLETRQKGLKERCVLRDASGMEVGSKVGVFGVVDTSGVVKPGMRIDVVKPVGESKPLEII